MRRLALLVSLLAVLTFPAEALAVEVVRQDDQGRPMRFDVRAEGVDVDWYADLLRRAAHGNEISTASIRIVSFDELRATCGARAGGCYSGRGDVVVVPAGRDDGVAHTLLHEYGHHVDASYGHGDLPEPNGTPLWWRVRSMAALVDLRSVAFDYSRGWSRSIGEIFAEDYARIHLQSQYAIEWLEPPDDLVRQSLLADVGLAEAPTATPPPPAVRPVVIVRRGTLGPRAAASIPFGLLGPGRRVRFSAQLAGSTRPGTRARLEISCGGRRLAARTVRRGQAQTLLDVRPPGPAECVARLVSTSRLAHRFTLTLALSVAA